MERSSWVANSSSTSQKISEFYGIPKVQYHCHNSSPLLLILRQVSPVQASLYFFTIHFNITFLPALTSSKRCLSLKIFPPKPYVPTWIWETKFHTRIDQEAKLTSDVSLCGWKSCLFLLLQKSSGWGTSNTSGNSRQWCPAVALFSAYYNSCVTPNVVFRRNPDRSYESQTLVDLSCRTAANRWCISIWGIRLEFHWECAVLSDVGVQ